MSQMKLEGNTWITRDGEYLDVLNGGMRLKIFDVGHGNDQPSLTKQEFAKECDINHIMAQYQRTGLVAHVSRFNGDYSDVADAVDYQTALNIMKQAQDMFESVPSTIRAEFDNDPGKFLAFVQNPENAEKMYEMGLAVKKEVPNVPEAAVVVPAAKS